jgi:glycosyltransferase involved in cell wall biosynthesis
MAAKRILFLSNLPTPYQIDFLEELSALTDIRAVFLYSSEANRDWTLRSHSWMNVLNKNDLGSKWKDLLLELSEFKPDCVIVGGYKLPLANRIKLYCWKNAVQYFYWLEKPLPRGGIRAFIRSIIWRITLPYSAGVLSIGSEAEKIYRLYSPLTFNLPYSINASRYPRKAKLVPDLPLRCLFVGQYIHRKGVNELLRAFEVIDPNKASISLAGSGELLPLVQKYVASFPHIFNLGFVEPESLVSIFSDYDVLVLPSRHDGWAVVVAEALASGIPVIGTKMTGAFVDLVVPNGCGRECAVDAKSIRELIEFYAQNPESVLREGLLGRKALLESRAESGNAARSLLNFLQNL